MYLKLGGAMVYLWRAVDNEGEILESYITETRDKNAAPALMKKAPKRHGSPAAITQTACARTAQHFSDKILQRAKR